MKELKLDRLELPGDGWVEFNNPEELSGEQVDRLFDVVIEGGSRRGSHLTQIAAELLIARWNIPDRPNLPLPSEDPKWWGQVPWRTKSAITHHMLPTVKDIVAVLNGEVVDDPGSQPVSE